MGGGNPISASSTNWQPRESGQRAMKTGLCHPACQSKGAPGGMGICHRLCASPQAAAASPAEGNKDRKVGRGKVRGSDKQKYAAEPAWLEELKEKYPIALPGKGF